MAMNIGWVGAGDGVTSGLSPMSNSFLCWERQASVKPGVEPDTSRMPKSSPWPGRERDRRLSSVFHMTDFGRRASGSATLNRSEEHTSELQSLMRISYAVFCLKKKRR